MKASDLFVKALEKEGVEYIFGIPGEENLDFLESLRNSSIRFIATRHEQVGAFMAATFGRLTNKTGVCLATLGPGATNLFTGASYAQLGGMPLLLITGQKEIRGAKQGQFQIVNVVEMMGQTTKYARRIESGDNIGWMVREAFRRAEEDKPGAVHLELPEDIAREQTGAPLLDRSNVTLPVASESAIDDVVEALRNAKRPLAVIASSANRHENAAAISTFITRLGLPFISTQMGKGAVDERLPNFIGNASLSDKDYVHRSIDRADLILNIGHDDAEKPPFVMHHNHQIVAHINCSPAAVDPVYFPQLEVIGKISDNVLRIAEKLGTQTHWDFSFFEKERDKLEASVKKYAADDHYPVRPPYLVKTVREAMPDDGIIALDNGIYKIWFARNYKAYHPNTVLLDNCLATMGAGLASAMAAKIASPSCKVMAICGDGGFMMNCQDLETAVRLKLDLAVLILRDNAYGMIEWKQAGMDFPSFGLGFGNPDFVAFAESFGARGFRVESSDTLLETLENALKIPGVKIIDCPVDYSWNDRLLHKTFQQEAAALEL